MHSGGCGTLPIALSYAQQHWTRWCVVEPSASASAAAAPLHRTPWGVLSAVAVCSCCARLELLVAGMGGRRQGCWQSQHLDLLALGALPCTALKVVGQVLLLLAIYCCLSYQCGHLQGHMGHTVRLMGYSVCMCVDPRVLNTWVSESCGLQQSTQSLRALCVRTRTRARARFYHSCGCQCSQCVSTSQSA